MIKVYLAKNYGVKHNEDCLKNRAHPRLVPFISRLEPLEYKKSG